MSEIFAIGFLENIKVLFVGILIYALIFALLKKIGIFDDPKINSLLALISAIIVSFTGVVTYAVSYAINWFVIILFLIFIIMTLLMFLGIKPSEIADTTSKNFKVIAGIFGVLFLIILIKGFFALNNTFDTNEPLNDSYAIDTSYNTGVDDITNKEVEGNFLQNIFNSIDDELLSAVLFLAVLGIFIFIIGS